MSLTSAAAILASVFHHDAFRFGQDRAVDSVLAGRDTVVLLPTGAGKSLCYQVPAIVASRRGAGTTLVVSPLIALMMDQASALAGRGVRVAAIHSQQDDDAQKAVVASFLRGELELLYVSPERAALESFRRMLRRVRIALIAIDEAHCVSQWGHDFRPEYLRLHELRLEVAAPVIALTATATPRVIDEIIQGLALRDPTFLRGDFRRPNLRFSVQHHRSDAARLEATIAACEAAGLRGRTGPGRGIVYCSTRKKTEAVAAALKKAGFAAGHYHAGRTALARERAQGSFAFGRARILVATCAFGMGVDYPDVRLIVHFQAPGSLEAYYQEAGRAGRDGGDAACLLLFGAGDLVTQRRLQSGAGSESRLDEALRAVERYARSSRCRQQDLCAHFDPSEESAACDRCDVCTDSVGTLTSTAAEVTPSPLTPEQRQIILAAAAHLERPVGKRALAKALRRSRAASMRIANLGELPERGALADLSEASVLEAIEQLVRERRLERRGRRFPTVWLAGRPVRGRADRGAVAARRPRASTLTRELEAYRRRMSRQLSWKPYMVFQRRVIAAIEAARPQSPAALAQISGLGPAKIARFGADILELVRRHPSPDAA